MSAGCTELGKNFCPTGCPEDHLFFHIPLISGISGQIRLIFHMLNKQRLKFDLVYRTLGYIFMYREV